MSFDPTHTTVSNFNWQFGKGDKKQGDTPSAVQSLAERQYQRMLERDDRIERNQRARTKRKKFEDHIR